MVATRRPLVPRWLVIVGALTVLAVTYLGVAAAGQTGPEASLASAPVAEGATEDARRDASGPDRSRREAVPTFAEVDGLELALPHPEPVAIGFHEASQPEALGLEPVGQLQENDNATKFTAPPDAAGGPAYRVLSSRGRGRPATSAADIAVPNGALAASPVSGTVVEVREYALYGGLDDWRVVIQPESRPDLHVVLIHLHEPHVAVGDAVVAGETTIGLPRLLPFTSHVDYILEGEHPHLHLEVKAAGPAGPLDPNAQALEASERFDVDA